MRLPSGVTLPDGARPPIASFRLYPGPGTRYIRVMIWPTVTALRTYKRFGGHSVRHAVGTCLDIRKWKTSAKRTRRSPVVAEVNLSRSHITMEVVTHELFHATMAWGRRIGFDWSRLGADDAVNADEEQLTYVHGRLCRDYMIAAEGAGLYTSKPHSTRG